MKAIDATTLAHRKRDAIGPTFVQLALWVIDRDFQAPMPSTPTLLHQLSALVAIKIVHTVAWAFFAGCIIAIPLAAWWGHYAASAWLAAIVLSEVLLLAANGWRCPLTTLASRFTEQRHDNFDIYLPLWLARHNKPIFGVLYVSGLVFAFVRWRES